jgi:hypothetical protein
MNITTNKSLMNLYTKDNQGTSLIKHGTLIESSSLHYLDLQNVLQITTKLFTR